MMETNGFWEDALRSQKLVLELRDLKHCIGNIPQLETKVKELNEFLDISSDDPEMLVQIEKDSSALLAEAVRTLEEKTRGADDHKAAYLTIQAGSGGREANNWAEMLLRMYAKMANKLGLTAILVDVDYHDPDGINFATLKIAGSAYGHFKFESGVHRLSRVSPFDQADRRQTSFAAVDVVPESPPDAEFVLNPKDLDVYYTCGTGPGGQAINKTEVVAVVKHIPTGIIVRSQETRSQQQNKQVALDILRSKLIKRREEELEAEAEKQKGATKAAAFGGQALRSYVLSQHPAVHDHRTGNSTSRVDDVLDGDLGDLF